MSYWRIIRILCASALIIVILFLQTTGRIIFSKDTVIYSANFYNCTDAVMDTLTNINFSNIHLQEDADQCSIVISANNSFVPNKNWKNSTIGYSPIVAYFPTKLTPDTDNNFHRIDISQYHYYLMIDMKKIIMTFVDNNTSTLSSTELGFTKEINNIHLGIPSIECGYRKDVVDSIIYLITNNKGVTENNKDDVQDILDKILNLSIDIKNPVNYMTNNDDCIILMPEYLINECADYNYPVYWKDAYGIQLQLWYNTSDSNINEESIQSYIKNIREYDKLLYKIGFRSYVKQEKLSSTRLYYVCPRFSILKNADTSNFENLLGAEYWV